MMSNFKNVFEGQPVKSWSKWNSLKRICIADFQSGFNSSYYVWINYFPGMINKQLIIDPASEYFYLWEEPPIEPGNLFDIYHLQLIFSYSKYTIFLNYL
jgi:hypothetical protein